MGRLAKRYSQADRLIRMIRTLASRAATVQELAAAFGVTRRQVYRDLGRVQEEGHPLKHDGEGRDRLWQLPLGYKGLPQITLSPNELMALYLAKSHLTYLHGTPFAEDLDRVLEKITTGLPRKTINHLERILQVFISRPTMVRPYAVQRAALTLLRQALLLQRTVRLHYLKAGREAAEIQAMDPYSLLLYDSGLYLVGYSHLARDLRKYAVERIQQVELTDELFAIRPELLRRVVTQRPFGIIEDPAMDIRIRFSREVAYLLKERMWHPTQKLQPLGNGDVLLTMQAGGSQEILRWILCWGPTATVLGPPELVELVTTALSQSLRHYNPTTR
ncbi:MAG: helix-turn-helix transcriptional regulator [Nitrospiraceae bacterium]